ncbi:MAG: sigma-70 family RNA polymerase sigma factor [Actinomycetota bacterium]
MSLEAWSSVRTDPEQSTDEELLRRIDEGDERALLRLIERYRPVAKARARTYFLAGGQYEDVVQEGLVGLFKAIRDFDGSLGAPFSAFAKLCVSRQILTAVKNSTRHKHSPLNSSLSLDAPAAPDGTLSLGDSLHASSLADPAAIVTSADEIEAIRKVLGSELTSLENDVLSFYLDGMTYEQIAAAVGGHAKSIDNALQRLRNKLRESLAARDAL